jgi:hypothetical protein
MKLESLRQSAHAYGFELLDLTGNPNYTDRKGKVWALRDRRTAQIVCTYATLRQIQAYLDRFPQP